jgi:hypothetical protein
MPVVAVVAAIGTVSAGAAMGGVLGGIMIAGGVMSGVGAVTGNKNLMKLGAVASLGAGIGSAMGLAGAANQGWNSLVGAGAEGTGNALGVTGNSFLNTGGSLEAIGNAIGRNSPVSGAETAITPSGAEAAGTSTLQVPKMELTQPQLVQGSAPGFKLPDVGTTSASSVPQSTGILSKSLDFIKQNPEVVKAGSGLIGGAMNSYSQQQQQEAVLQSQADARTRMNNSILGQGYYRPTSRR